MSSTELAANLFQATQTEAKLSREQASTKDHANRIHNEVGKRVRQTIQELGATMLENLPVAEDIKKVARREKKGLKDEQKQIKQEGKKEIMIALGTADMQASLRLCLIEIGL